MDYLQRIVQDLLRLAKSGFPALKDTERLAQSLIEMSSSANPEEMDRALRDLSPAIASSDLSKAAIIAITCGALVEKGGDPSITYQVILDRLSKELSQRRASASEKDVDRLCMAAIASLSRSVSARRKIRNDSGLVAQFQDPITGGMGFLMDLLRSIDEEELVVLHPEFWRGFRVKVIGIADNFQLHTLIADGLIGDPDQGWLPGIRPDARVVRAAKDSSIVPDDLTAHGIFNLVSWKGLLPDGQVSSDYKLWIWGEGSPSEIPAFEGTRIVFLTPLPYTRTWNAERKFSGMHADMKVVEIFTLAVVQGWLERIASANAGHRVELTLEVKRLAYIMGRARLEAGDAMGAIRDLSESLRLDSSFDAAYITRGNARSQIGDLTGSLTDYDHAIQLNPENSNYHDNRGSIRGRLGDSEGAKADFSEAIRLNPKIVSAYVNRSVEHQKQHNYSAALSDLDRAIELSPQSALAYCNRSAVYCDLGDFDKAVADSTQALQIDPNYATAYNNRAYALYKKGNYREALPDSNEAISRRKHAYFYNTRGRIRGAVGDCTGAISDFQEALRLMPSHPEAEEMKKLIEELQAKTTFN